MIMPDDPVMVQAVEAMKRYHRALATALPSADVERLRLDAEQQFQSLNNYQLAILGYQHLERH